MVRRVTARAKWEAAHAAALATGYPKAFLIGVDAEGNLVVDTEGARAWLATPAGRAWEEANRRHRHLGDGERRKAGRLKTGRVPEASGTWWNPAWLPANSNAPLIGFIVRELDPQLLTAPRLTRSRVNKIQTALRRPAVLAKMPERLRREKFRADRPPSVDTLMRAIRQARERQNANPVPPPPE